VCSTGVVMHAVREWTRVKAFTDSTNRITYRIPSRTNITAKDNGKVRTNCFSSPIPFWNEHLRSHHRMTWEGWRWIVNWFNHITSTMRQCSFLFPYFMWRHAVTQLVEALHYKPEGRGFDSRWFHWIFFLIQSLQVRVSSYIRMNQTTRRSNFLSLLLVV
jgi:hypothetical protein